jgi:hypothetical protein
MSDGWAVIESDPRGVVSAAKDGRARIGRPGEYFMPVRGGVPPAPGEKVNLIARLDHLEVDRGIWWAFTEPPPEQPIGRIYLNVRPATAALAVREATLALSLFSYQLKCPILASACDRVDAVVIYHARAERDDALAALSHRWSSLGPLLDRAVPPLTCMVGPGLSWADDVDEQQSYGASRCQALAVAIDRAAPTWASMGLDERVTLLVDGLRAAGIDAQSPWRADR